MNTSGFLRGMMAKGTDPERFIIHVANCVERELKQWDENYRVVMMKLQNYEIYINYEDTSYHLTISEDELVELKQKGPYSLNQRIWFDLQNQGMEIVMGYGNYLEYIFM